MNVCSDGCPTRIREGHFADNQPHNIQYYKGIKGSEPLNCSGLAIKGSDPLKNGCAQDSGLDGVEVVYGSGAVKNACQVLDYPAACYVKLPRFEDGGGSIWDFAATVCIVGEAGGWASNIYGQPLELNRLGSTFMNHQGVLYASNERIARYLIDTL
jgi:3'-phosphoadenosine 5'-phosphosulfate (PAPS) 3'-phosphatase